VTIRNTHERPEGMDAGTLIMSGLRSEEVLNAVEVILAQRSGYTSPSCAVDDYHNPAVSSQVVRIVLSYTGYVNRTVWHKY
jgi:UDP-N-acetylglucosamine 2-epimerase (non-hydrolysing)